jgi:hypothetical protein
VTSRSLRTGTIVANITDSVLVELAADFTAEVTSSNFLAPFSAS